MEELYYSHPVQVRYWNSFYQKYLGAIAYHDFLICGHCGEINLITDIIDAAANDGKNQDDAIIELDWLNISGNILGI